MEACGAVLASSCKEQKGINDTNFLFSIVYEDLNWFQGGVI